MAEEKQLSNYEVSMYNARGLNAMMALARTSPRQLLSRRRSRANRQTY